jgi:hypothetical protein
VSSTPITQAPFTLDLEPGSVVAEAASDFAPNAVKVGVWRMSPLEALGQHVRAGAQAIGDIWQVTGARPTQLAITVAPEVFEELAIMERTPVINATFEPDRITVLVTVDDGSHVEYPPIPLVLVRGAANRFDATATPPSTTKVP